MVNELVSDEQEMDKNEDAERARREGYEDLHASNQLENCERNGNFTNVNKAESPILPSRGSDQLIEEIDNSRGSETVNQPSPILCARPIPGTYN